MRILHQGLSLEVDDEPISIDMESKTAVYAVKDGEQHGASWKGCTVTLPLVSKAGPNPDLVH